MKRENLRSVMQFAWNFVKKYGYTMSEAMKQAWKVVKNKLSMYKGITAFKYIKKGTGEVRYAVGSLDARFVPQTGNARRSDLDTVIYFDIDRGAWRSYKATNLI